MLKIMFQTFVEHYMPGGRLLLRLLIGLNQPIESRVWLSSTTDMVAGIY